VTPRHGNGDVSQLDAIDDLIRDIYLALLDRPPEKGAVLSQSIQIRTYGLASVLRRIARSREAMHVIGVGDRRRVGLAGNCQVPVIAAYLRKAGVLALAVADINERELPQFDLGTEELLRGDLDVVLSQPVFSFEEVATERLRQLYGERLVTFTNVSFTGLHPDMQGGSGLRGVGLVTPLGEWHSGIVVGCYLRGMRVQDCIRQFNSRTYERLGYFEAFARASEELVARDAGLTVRFAEEFLGMIYEGPALLTGNHPTSAVMARLATRIAVAVNLGTTRFDPGCVPNPFLRQIAFPIYPEIAEHLRLPYRTPFTWHTPEELGGHDISLEELVLGSYKAYAAFDQSELRRIFAPSLARWEV
jgi:hypothetical protein